MITINCYTGVGSRNAPPEILHLMKQLAYILAKNDWILRSGGATGSDTAFEIGCDLAKGKKEIYLAKDATKESKKIAGQFHPVWNSLKPFVKSLHGRNTLQVLGPRLRLPSKFLICWTDDGCESHEQRSINTGGTGTAISIAEHYNVKIFNLKNEENFKKWKKIVDKHF